MVHSCIAPLYLCMFRMVLPDKILHCINAVTVILCVHHLFRELRMEAIGKQKAHYTFSLTGSDQLKLPFQEQFLDIFIAYLYHKHGIIGTTLILKASFTVVLKCSLYSSMPGNQRLSSISVFHFILICLNVSVTAREIEEWVPGVRGAGGESSDGTVPTVGVRAASTSRA